MHLVPVADAPSRQGMRACCGAAFAAGELEVLDHVTGMPCEECLRRAAAFSSDVAALAGDDELRRVEVALARLDARVGELAGQVRAAVALIGDAKGGAHG